MDRFPPPPSPRSARPTTFAKHLRHRAPAIGLRPCHPSRQHVSPSRRPLHRIPSRSPSANQTCSFNSTIPILETKFCPVGRWIFGVRRWAFDVYLRLFCRSPISFCLLLCRSSTPILQHSNLPRSLLLALSPLPLASVRLRRSTFRVRCSMFISVFSAVHRSRFTDHVCLLRSLLPAPPREANLLRGSPLPGLFRRSTFGVRRWALGVGRWAFISPLSGVTAPPIHCFARDLLLYCFMTKSRCWPAHSRHAELPNL